MKLQQDISLSLHQSLEGRVLEVLVDEVTPEGQILGRTYRDAPEIDGKVIVSNPGRKEKFQGIQPGDFLQVKVTRGLVYDLEGEVHS